MTGKMYVLNFDINLISFFFVLPIRVKLKAIKHVFCMQGNTARCGAVW